MAAARTGVTKTNNLSANRVAMVTNGNNTLLLLKPGIARVLLVISRLVKDTVVLTPANITDNIKISWAPAPEYFKLDENGVIKVQPAVTKVLFEHFVKYSFFLPALTTLDAAYQNDSG